MPLSHHIHDMEVESAVGPISGPMLGNPLECLRVGLVELRGIEPLTSAVRLQRSPI